MLTAYDYFDGEVVDAAGIRYYFSRDSAPNVYAGHEYHASPIKNISNRKIIK